MKTLLALLLACATGAGASAQLFRPEVVSGALLGGVAGAVIGHNDGRHGWEGAAYGAAAGALLGAIVGESRDVHAHGRTQVPVPRVYAPAWDRPWDRGPYGAAHPAWAGDYPGYGYGHRRVQHPRRWHHDTAHPSASRGDRVFGGALLGAGVGAIIGHNQGRRGWEGAAYGALAGAVLGAVTDRVPAHPVVRAPRAYEEPVAPAAAPQQITIINHYHAPAAPANTANALFGR